MTEQAKTKQQASIEAMKNANKHLTDVFNQMQRMDSALSSVANDLERAASKVGDILILCWKDRQEQPATLRVHLKELAIQLQKAREP